LTFGKTKLVNARADVVTVLAATPLTAIQTDADRGRA
jgi:hypothetical protein